MRRVLPRTLVRAVQVQARTPRVAMTQRVNFSSTPRATASKRKSAAESPAKLPPALHKSIKESTPLAVAWRKSEWPSHPNFSDSPTVDPEMYDLNRSTPKRMPLRMELDFDRWRLRGFFPGQENIARTHYLDAMRLFRNRVRGEVGQVFDRQTKEWKTQSRTVFLIQDHIAKNLPLDVAMVRPLETAEDLVYAGRVHLELSDIDQAKFAEKFPNVEFEESILGYENQVLFPLVNLSALEERIAALEDQKAIDRTPYKTQLVGNRIYLPNIIVRLVRNYTPQGEPYNPYVATFRIPLGMTKTDLRSYLKTLYNLDTTFIRTVVYRGKVTREQRTLRKIRERGAFHNYKKAVVGLYEPFHYPDDLDELRALGRSVGLGDELYEKRLQTLEESYYLKANKDMRKRIVQRAYKKAVRYRAKGEGHLGRTIKQIMERRRAREELVQNTARKLRSDSSLRAQGVNPETVHQ